MKTRQKKSYRDSSSVESVEKDNNANLRMPLGMRTNTKSSCIPNGMLFVNVVHFFIRSCQNRRNRVIQRFFGIIIFLQFLSYSTYAQKEKEKNVVDILIECYETYYPKRSCPPIPNDFYDFFKTTFIDFQSLRKIEKVNSFSFSDKLTSPLNRNLEITSPYGMRNGKKHFGVDFRVNTGDTVYSIFCGKVRVAKWDDSYGFVVVVRHYNMSETVYAHLDKILVAVDQEVEAGKPVGLGGNTGVSTGPHLHFELRYKGYPINPIVGGRFLTFIAVGYK